MYLCTSMYTCMYVCLKHDHFPKSYQCVCLRVWYICMYACMLVRRIHVMYVCMYVSSDRPSESCFVVLYNTYTHKIHTHIHTYILYIYMHTYNTMHTYIHTYIQYFIIVQHFTYYCDILVLQCCWKCSPPFTKYTP